MRKSLWMKSLVVGIIPLFIGTSIIPSVVTNVWADPNPVVWHKNFDNGNTPTLASNYFKRWLAR